MQAPARSAVYAILSGAGVLFIVGGVFYIAIMGMGYEFSIR